MTNPLRISATVLALMLASGASIGAESRSDAETDSASSVHALIGTPISDAILGVSEDVKLYNEHLTTLASPYMMGRVPGSIGMDRAREYCAFTFEQLGIEPGFPVDDGTPYATYYDTFDLRGTTRVVAETIAMQGLHGLEAGEDFLFTGLGSDGGATGELVFVGYGIDNGPDGFDSFAGVDDLEGRIAVVLRFEPVDENGEALWGDGAWSGRASFNNKLRGLSERGAAGAIIINTPGTFDTRSIGRFLRGGSDAEFPVFMMTPEAGTSLVESADFGGMDLTALRGHADAGGAPIGSDETITIFGESERETIEAANVGGVIRGSGELADEWIVVGAHLDHLGMGYFGSRSGSGTLHPGADDNASGSAAVLVLAKILAERNEEVDGDRRSVLLMLFDGEESGLHGSRHYVNDPIADAENHVLMFNWDMIGRLTDETVVLAGLDTGEGMREFFTPLFEGSGLEVKAPERMSGASDHTSFFRAGIPVVFSHADGLHRDYHTPGDTSDKINRVGATKAVHLVAEMVDAYASYPDRFELSESSSSQSAGPVSGIKVRFGIMPGSYSDDEPGVSVGDVTADSAAGSAGVLAGDRLGAMGRAEDRRRDELDGDARDARAGRRDQGRRRA